jgi:hypothetical protein
MTATAHALVGGAIAASVPNPFLGMSLATASHPILDMIPHWDEGWGWRQKSKQRIFIESALDLSVGIAITFFLFGQFTSPIYLMACIIAANLWDILMVPYLFGFKTFPFSWVYKIQSHMQGKAKLPWGVLTQVATVIVAIFLLNNIPH